MNWKLSNRADPVAVKIADRHYNRQKPGTPQFVPPGSCMVLLSIDDRAVWTTSWPIAEYVKHEWAGAWVNSIFRNEGEWKASDMIREAVAATLWFYGKPPGLGMVTFIDPTKVKPIKRRGKNVWGYSYEKAGFRHIGETKGGLLAFQLLPVDMPEPQPPVQAQLSFVDFPQDMTFIT
jgi:hypothetical protein